MTRSELQSITLNEKKESVKQCVQQHPICVKKQELIYIFGPHYLQIPCLRICLLAKIHL